MNMKYELSPDDLRKILVQHFEDKYEVTPEHDEIIFKCYVDSGDEPYHPATGPQLSHVIIEIKE